MMTNAERFKQLFGLYATELWSKSEKDFLTWLNAEYVPNTNVGELISIQDAIDALESKVRYTDYDEPVVDWNDLVAALVSLPSAQPRKGKWMPDNTNYYDERYICSECNANYKVDTCMGKPSWNFCPNCGADMRGDAE